MVGFFLARWQSGNENIVWLTKCHARGGEMAVVAVCQRYLCHFLQDFLFGIPFAYYIIVERRTKGSAPKSVK